MPSLADLWKKIGSSPEASKLTFSQLVDLRIQVLRPYLSTDPTTAHLTPEQQTSLLQKLAFSPPRFDNPQDPFIAATVALMGKYKAAKLAGAGNDVLTPLENGLLTWYRDANFKSESILSQMIPGEPSKRDSILLSEWMQSNLTDPYRGLPSKMQWEGDVGRTVGFLLDGLPMNIVSAGVGGLVAGAVRTGVTFASRAAAAIVPSVIGFLTDQATNALLGIARDEDLSQAYGRGSVFDKGLAKVAGRFGMYFATNILWGSILGLGAKLAKSTWSVVTGKARSIKPRPFTGDQFGESLSRISDFGLSEGNLAQMSDVDADFHYWRLRVKDSVETNGAKITDDVLGRAYATTSAMNSPRWLQADGERIFFAPLSQEASQFRITREVRGRFFSTIAQNANDLERKITEVASGLYRAAPEKFTQEFPHMVAQVERFANLPKAFDPAIGPEIAKVYKDAGIKPEGTGFRPLSKRSAMNSAEIDIIRPSVEARGGIAVRVALPEGAIDLEAVARRPTIRKPFARALSREIGSGVKLEVSSTGNGAVILSKIAKPTDIVEASAWAKSSVGLNRTLSLEDLTNWRLMQRGFDGYQIDPKTVVALFPENIKVISNVLDVTGKPINPLKVPPPSQRDYAIVRGTIDSVADFSGKAPALDDIALVASTKLRGAIRADDVENVVRLYYKAAGVADVESSVKILLREPGSPAGAFNVGHPSVADLSPRITSLGGELRVPFPRVIRDPTELRTSLKALFENLNKDIQLRFKVRPEVVDVRIRGIEGFPLSKRIPAQWKFIDALGAENLRLVPTATGRDLFDAAGTKVASFATPEEAFRWFRIRGADDGFLTQALASRGWKVLRAKPGEYVIAGPGGKTTGNTLADAIEDSGVNLDKVSVAFAPKDIILSNEGFTVRGPGVVSGSYREAVNLLSKFEDPTFLSAKNKIASWNGGTLSSLPSGDIWVEIPRWGINRRFPGIKEARAFISGDIWSDMSELNKIALTKGITLSAENGRYIARGLGEEVILANKQEVMDFFKDLPDFDAAKSILDSLDPTIDRDLAEAILKTSFKKIPHASGVEALPIEGVAPWNYLTIRDTLRYGLSDFNYFTEKTLPSVDPTGNVLDAIRKAERSARAMHSATNETEVFLRRIFIDEHGHPMKPERLEALTDHMGAQDASETAKALSLHGPLTSAEQVASERLREFYNMLFKRFGLQTDTFIQNYMPRIREAITSGKLPHDEGLAIKALEKTFGRDSPMVHSLTPFFEHSRTSELLQFALANKNAMETACLYAGKGFRKEFMDIPFKELNISMARHLRGGDTASSQIRAWILQWRDSIQGFYKTPGEKWANTFGEGFARGLGVTDPTKLARYRDLYKEMLALNSVTNMAFKPFAAIKNQMQINLVAARFGFDATDRAWSRVLNPKEYEKMLPTLKNIGVILDNPVLDSRAQGKLLSWVGDRGLRWFRNADDLSRAVAYYTAQTQLDDTLLLFAKGRLTTIDQFMERSGITLVDRGAQREIRTALESAFADQTAIAKGPSNVGNSPMFEAVRNLYGRQISDECMFIPTRANAPGIHQGLVGRLFGQFGSYSAGYRETIFRGLANGNKAQRVAFMTRFVLSQTAIWGALALVGINSPDFFPFVPALFAGGPAFQSAIDLLNAPSQGPEGAIARNNLMRSFSPIVKKKGELQLNYPSFVPFGPQANYLRKAFEYAEQGDPWRSFLSFTFTPVLRPTP